MGSADHVTSTLCTDGMSAPQNLTGQNLTQELGSQLWQRRAWKTEAEEKHQHVLTDRLMDHEIADITVWAHWRALFCKLLGFVNLNSFASLILS